MLAVLAFLSFQEVIIILFVAILLFGPKKIPEIARGLGEGLRAMKNATDQIKREVMDGMDNNEPIKEIKKTQEEIEKEIEDAKKKIDETVGPVERKRF